MESLVKDPDAVLDFGRDWSPWLATGEQITTSTWIVPDGITKDSESNDTTTATVWLSGGTAGETYEITNRITTNQGRTDDRTLRILVRER
jgi:hypothetical protein